MDGRTDICSSAIAPCIALLPAIHGSMQYLHFHHFHGGRMPQGAMDGGYVQDGRYATKSHGWRCGVVRHIVDLVRCHMYTNYQPE